MKKLFISIMALAAFVACQSNFDDVTTNTPGFGDGAVPEGLVKVYAEVGVGEETKATYGDDLSAKWEENDQIALVQESANYGSTFNKVNALDIKRGAGTNSAAFWGDINVPTESPRIYHIAYPVSAVSASTSMSQEVVVENVRFNESSPGLGNFYAVGYANCTYNSTLNITVPTSQSGKWEPYMYASTPEAVSADGIRATHLTTLTGAIAVRAYEADGVTPKKLSKVTISSANSAIAGAFTGTATSVGRTQTITGREADWGSYYTESLQTDARNNLIADLQGYTATSTSQTKAMSLAFAGTAKSVTVENANVAADDNGDYVYYINVAPFAGEKITIQAVAEDGTSLIRVIPSATLAASQRMRVKVTWEHAGLTNGSIETWYDSYAGNHSTTLAGNKVYVNNIVVEGVEASAVSAIGALVYDLNDNLVASNISANNTLSLSQVVVDVPTSGTYKVISYAKVTVNGEERDLTGESKEVNVTSIPTDASLIQSSYSKNGNSEPTNSIGGTALECTPALSDSTIPASLISSCQLVYGSTTVNASLNSKKSVSLALGQYSCYVKITLGNGFVCQSGTYATHITGIPYTLNTSSNDGTWTEDQKVLWNNGGGVRLGNYTDGVASIQKRFHLPANTQVKINNSGTIQASLWVTNKYDLYVSSSSVYNVSQNGGDVKNWDAGTVTATMSASDPTVKMRNDTPTNTSNTTVKVFKINYSL